MEDDIQSLRKSAERIDNAINNSLIADARESEEKDEARNFNRRNYIVIRNLAIPTGWDTSLSGVDKVNAISKFIGEELSKLIRIHKSDINVLSVFVLPITVDNHLFSPIRLMCETASDAVEARKRIINMSSAENSVWSNVDVQNDPVKATRVRLHLMNCIAKSLRSDDYNVVVVRYSDSPTIIVRKDRFSSGQLSFVDCILKYGDRLTSNDVTKARNICGKDFQGRRERLFLVIKEIDVVQTIPTPSQSNEPSTPGTNRSFRGSSRGRGSFRGRGRGRGRGNANHSGFVTGFVSSSFQNSSIPCQFQTYQQPQPQPQVMSSAPVSNVSNNSSFQTPIYVQQPNYAMSSTSSALVPPTGLNVAHGPIQTQYIQSQSQANNF